MKGRIYNKSHAKRLSFVEIPGLVGDRVEHRSGLEVVGYTVEVTIFSKYD